MVKEITPAMLWEYNNDPEIASVYRNGKLVTGELKFSECGEPLILSSASGFVLFDNELIEVGGKIFQYKSDNEQPDERPITFVEEGCKTRADIADKRLRGKTICLVKAGTKEVTFTGVMKYDKKRCYLLNEETREKKHLEEGDGKLEFFYKTYLDFLNAREGLVE